jgi:hypothetical protein
MPVWGRFLGRWILLTTFEAFGIMSYAEPTGEKLGICSICCERAPLTRDHVPPKGTLSVSDLQLRSLIEAVGQEAIPNERIASPQIVQGGVKFPSLCPHCNNELLGSEYDPALIEAARNLGAIIEPVARSPLTLPRAFAVELKPQRVARSVIGHLLAAEWREDMALPPPDTPMQSCMREYVQHECRSLPDQLDIFVWLYPSRRQTIVLGSAYADFRTLPEAVVGAFIKFFPFGFWVTFNRPKSARIHLEHLLPDKATPLDATRQIQISKNRTPSVHWPEAPGKWDVLLLNDTQAVEAVPRRSN